jgi:hypothetical protein
MDMIVGWIGRHRKRESTMRYLLALTLLVATSAVSPARADEPIVFQKTSESCYRIPSIAETSNGYLAVVERRRGTFGEKVCGDDGTIDLASKASSDGQNWSDEHVIVSSDKIGEQMASSASPIYDPAFASVSPRDRLVRIGNQGLVAHGRQVFLLFVVQYNIRDTCDNRSFCQNSPENVRAGDAKARYFFVKSDDGGRRWSEPTRIHAQMFSACTDQMIGDAALKASVKRLFVDDTKLTAEAYDTYLQVSDALLSKGDRDPEAAARLLGVSTATVNGNLPALRMLFPPLLRAGPGNGVAFQKGDATRVVFPAVPFTVYSDDGARSFRCGNTEAIVRGGERQVAWMGGDTLVMSLRLIGKGKPDLRDVRLFSLSHDGGETWSKDLPISEDGHNLMPDAIAQASIVGITDVTPPMALHFNLAKPDNVIDRPAVFRRKAKSEKTDRRNTLSAVRLYLEPNGLMPATTDGCDPTATGANVAYKVIWSGSAAYSAAVYSKREKSVGLLFEASDNSGPKLAYRAWAESVRFTKVALNDVKGTPPSAQACTR